MILANILIIHSKANGYFEVSAYLETSLFFYIKKLVTATHIAKHDV